MARVQKSDSSRPCIGCLACAGQRAVTLAMKGKPSSLDRDEDIYEDPRILTKKIARAESAAAVFDTIQPWVDNGEFQFNCFHIGTSWIRLAHHAASLGQCRASPVFQSLIRQTEQAIETGEMSPQATANLFWSIAKLHGRFPDAEGLIPGLVDLVKLHADSMDSQETSIVVYAAAVLELPDSQLRRLVPPLCARALDLAERDLLKAQDVSNVIWSSAKLGKRAPALLEMLEVFSEVARGRMEDFVPQAISNIIWAAGVLRPETSALQDLPALLADQAVTRGLIEKMTGQQVANACEGLALCKTTHTPFLAAVGERVVKESSSWKVGSKKLDLPQIALAFALLGVQYEGLMLAVATGTTPLLSSLQPVSICALAFSYDRMDGEGKFRDFRLRVAEELKKRPRPLSPEAVSQVQFGIQEWTLWFKSSYLRR